eukprot:Seg918.4 transcript_id=Seg918.4/GoldUCD/mRNA.D3Y31 product="Neurogenic locus protein delta" protein_id=Seg918.4/GoldUCD/D3Y31
MITTVTIVLLIGFGLIHLCKADFTAEIDFLTFENPGAKLFSGGKCDTYLIGSICETYFKLCVRLSNNNPRDWSNCKYFKQSSDVASNDINFKRQVPDIPNPIRFTDAAPWNEHIAFYMEVWDDDSVTDDDLIDKYQYSMVVTPGVNGTTSNVNHHTIYGRRTKSVKTTLFFTVNVYCTLHYYGTKCNIRCQQHDDDNNGHYTCSSTGSHICRSNWYSSPSCKTYCKAQNDTINGHYECDNLGQKVCHLGWHGDSCKTYCMLSDNDSSGHYNCSKDGRKVCHENWYGPKCSNYCKANNDTVGGYYDCTGKGKKICAKNYYGINCTVYCLLSQNATGNFICDKQTGAKICNSHWTGKYCNITMSSVILSTSAVLLTTRLNSIEFTSSIVVSSSVPLMEYSSFISMQQSIIKTSTTERLSTTVGQTFYSTSSIAFDLLPTSSFVLPSKSKTDSSRASFTTTTSSSMSTQLTTTPLVERTVTTSAVSPAATTATATTTKRASTTTHPEPTPVPTTEKTSPKPTTGKPSKAPSKQTTGKPSKAPPKQTTDKPIKPTKPNTKFDPDNKGDNSKIDKSTNTAKQSAQKKWLIETKEGRTVLFGSLFAFLMLIGVVVAVVMYLRSPKSPKFARKTKKRAFEHLEESPEDVKLENLFEKSHFNPLYTIPIDELEGKNERSKRKRKLEKFYTKKDAIDDDNDDGCNYNEMSNMTHDESVIGVFQNPLYGIPNRMFNKDETDM